jgi:hypothetical protein
MRLSCLLLVLVLLLPGVAAAQQPWVRAYREGIQAFERGNDALAESKLKEAKSKGPAQGRRVNFSGINYEPFIPDYYLGLIAARNARHEDARQLLEKAISDGLITQGQRSEYAAATNAIEAATNALRKPKDTAAEELKIARAEFQKHMASAEQALKNRRYDEARAGAKTARPSAKEDASRSELAAFEGRIRTVESADIAAQARDAISKGNDADAQKLLTRLAEVNPQYAGLDALRNDLRDLRQRRDAEQKAREADQIALRARTALNNRDAATAEREISRLADASPQHASLGQLRTDLRTLQDPKPTVNPQFVKLLAEARTHFDARRLDEARVSLDAAYKTAGDPSSRQQADQLRGEIEAAERRLTQEIGRAVKLAWTAVAAKNGGAALIQINELARLDPQHPELVKLRAEHAKLTTAPSTAGADIARIEREAVRQFFRGDYHGAKATLESSVNNKRVSPRIYLYLACSNAALSLLDGPSRNDALLQQARQQYAQAQPQRNPFTADRQYISPRILELLAATN